MYFEPRRVSKMISPISTPNSALIATESSENKRSLEKVKSEEVQEVTSKFDQIKESIKNNDYKIDLQKTSEKMALNLLNL